MQSERLGVGLMKSCPCGKNLRVAKVGWRNSERAKGKLRATANATRIINKKLPELNLRFDFDGRVDIVIFGDGGGWWWCFVDDLWWCSACRFGVGCECFERTSFFRRALWHLFPPLDRAQSKAVYSYRMALSPRQIRQAQLHKFLFQR